MAFGPQARPIATEEQLLSLAAALKAQAAQRYRDLASWAADHEDTELEALFRELCAMQVEHGAHVLSASLQRLGHEVTPATTQLLAARFEEPDLRSALLTPYRALSIAVRNEERAFAFYAEAAAYAETPMVRALAEDLARAELGHAAKLRRARRAAYRAEVSGERAARRAPPPGDLPALDREVPPGRPKQQTQAPALRASAPFRAMSSAICALPRRPRTRPFSPSPRNGRRRRFGGS